MDEDLGKGLLQRFQGPEVAVVALPLASEGGVQGVVEIVAPLGVQTVSARFS